jgi:hypothetical protein
MEQFLAYNYDYLVELARLSPDDPTRHELPVVIQDPAIPAEYARKLRPGGFTEKFFVQFEEGAGGDLMRATVELRWQFPLDDHLHGYTLAQLVARPSITLTDDADIAYTP